MDIELGEIGPLVPSIILQSSRRDSLEFQLGLSSSQSTRIGTGRCLPVWHRTVQSG